MRGVAIFSTSVLCAFTAYFLYVLGARIKFYMNRDGKKKSKQNKKAEKSVLEESHQVQGSLQDDMGSNSHPMLSFHMLSFAILVTVLLRCSVYIGLVALPYPPSQRGCDLMLELVHLLYGFGLVLLYAFVWRIQRHFYCMKIFQKFYTRMVERWSWSAVVCIALVSAGRVMISMAGWRYGVQYEPREEHSCFTAVYNVSRNVTEMEWNLPFTYNIACGILLLFVCGGLPLYLCIKADSIKVSEQRIPDGSLAAVKKKLKIITLFTSVSLASTIISQLVMLLLLPHSLPALFFNQIDDLATAVQVGGMIFCMDNWKNYLIPCFFNWKKKRNAARLLSNRVAVD